jgi:hypothetical protein
MALTDEQAVCVMNAWRRLTVLGILVDDPAVPPGVIQLVHEYIAPVIADLGNLSDQLPPEQVLAAARSPSAWFPTLRTARSAPKADR